MISKNLKLIIKLHDQFIEHFINNYPNTDFNVGGCGFVADSIFQNFSSFIQELSLKDVDLKIVLATDIPNYNESSENKILKDNKYYLDLISVERDKRAIEEIWCEQVDFLHVFVEVFDKKTKESVYFDNHNAYSKEDIREDLDWFICGEFQNKKIFDKILDIPECWSEEFDFYSNQKEIQKSIYIPLKSTTEEMICKSKIKQDIQKKMKSNNTNKSKKFDTKQI